MSIAHTMLKQTMCYWAAPVADGYGGHTFSAAVELSCRWERVPKWFTDNDGAEALAVASVFCETQLTPGGWLWLGTLATLPSPSTDPRTITGARTIRQFDWIGDIKGAKEVGRAYL